MDEQRRVIAALVEGNSFRSIKRSPLPRWRAPFLRRYRCATISFAMLPLEASWNHSIYVQKFFYIIHNPGVLKPSLSARFRAGHARTVSRWT